MKNLLLAVFLVLLAVLPASATQLSITFSPVDGDDLVASDFVNTWAEISSIVNHIQHDNIDDSNVTWREHAQNSVNSWHIAPQSVTADKIDSGAIAFDTQFAFGLSIADRLVSNTDTSANWMKFTSGMYVGDGSDTRFIDNTMMEGITKTGDSVAMTVVKVVVYSADLGVGAQTIFSAIDGDTVIFNLATAGDAYRINDFVNSGFYYGNNSSGDNLKALGVNGFYVSQRSGGTVTLNQGTQYYVWEAWGY